MLESVLDSFGLGEISNEDQKLAHMIVKDAVDLQTC